MNSFKYILLIAIVVLSVQASAQKVRFIQDDKVYEVGAKDMDSITIDRKPFSIRYFCRQYDGQEKEFYGAHIAVLDNDTDLKGVKAGIQSTTIPFFDAGTGMAPGTNGMYDTMVISNSAHHYLTYESDTSKSVYLVGQHKKDLELEWKISAVTYQGKDLSFAALPIDHFYFVIFIDHNLDQTIDDDELTVVKVNLR